MRLTKLELSGFKSFAKTTVLEFPSRVTGIVGPNGSGKSNIKEAIQWVLGEQSMKSLRGKKGEDLIWNGSPEVPRMGKASVTLVFDNADGTENFDFSEAAVQRKIFRDGVNEYSLNDSPVRLKDVAELTARMGLGESKHNIIGQGEVDRVLLASPKDRYRMLESALGLRVYHLKKAETERKLEATAQNIVQAQAVIRELVPHLKFLRSTAHKASTRASVEEELRDFERRYFIREDSEIKEFKTALNERAAPPAALAREHEEEIARLTRSLTSAERLLQEDDKAPGEEEGIAILEEKRREIERELGRLEGKLEAGRRMNAGLRIPLWSAEHWAAKVTEFLGAAKAVLARNHGMPELLGEMAVLLTDLERFMSGSREAREAFEKNSAGSSGGDNETERTIRSFQDELSKISDEIAVSSRARTEQYLALRVRHEEIRQIDAALRARQDEMREVALERQRIEFERERLKGREAEFIRELAQAGMDRASLGEAAAHDAYAATQEELLKKIQRIRARLEEIGGIDPGLVKEHEETEARHAFLAKELEDLKAASSSLKDLVKELNLHIKKDFREGFAKIKDAFSEYFRLIFGGGKATLEIVRAERIDADDGGIEDGAADESEVEPGIELTVDLPRKRIRGLAMLSGGERALASIALLFAISAVNPPPFLILDETDAALDEANSERFGALLKELSKKTQLLVITHNRETMKSAGILYGVTMGHDGVSKLLSLKLEDAEEYTNR